MAIQRIGELAWATRNERRLRERGGQEHNHGHYRAMVALHCGWLICIAVESASTRRTRPVLLVAYALLQPLRFWVIRSLGDRWTTKIYTVPGDELVTHGPYKWVRHPNYAVVAVEMALLPLGLGAPLTSGVFTGLNALMMSVRIPAETRALAADSLRTPRWA